MFRGFSINPDNILNFTDKFTKQYASDANRRTNLYGKKNINTVENKKQFIDLVYSKLH